MFETLIAALLVIAALSAMLWLSASGKKRLAAQLAQAQTRIAEQDALIERARLRDDIDRATARLDSEALHQQLEGDYRD